MVLVGLGSVSFYTDQDPDSGSSHFLYGSGFREMIRIPRIRIRHTDTSYNVLLTSSGKFSIKPMGRIWILDTGTY